MADEQPVDPFDDALREIEEGERGDFLTIPAWTAVLTAIGATIAELDSVPPEDRTTENALARIHWFLENPSRDMPQMVLREEAAVQVLEQTLVAIVDSYRDRMSNL